MNKLIIISTQLKRPFLIKDVDAIIRAPNFRWGRIFTSESLMLWKEKQTSGYYIANLPIKLELQLKYSQSWKLKAHVSICFNSV